MSGHAHHEIVAVRAERIGGHEHNVEVRLADGSERLAEDVIAAIEAGDVYTMRPPEGAPAYAAHQRTGLPLLVQVRQCPDCNEKVLFA